MLLTCTLLVVRPSCVSVFLYTDRRTEGKSNEEIQLHINKSNRLKAREEERRKLAVIDDTRAGGDLPLNPKVGITSRSCCHRVNFERVIRAATTSAVCREN